MESNTTKYDLMKIIKSLDRESKIRLIDGWDKLIEKTAKIEESSYLVKEASISDPETSEQILNIINLLEKFLKIDDNISYKNICVFISPIMMGSKKITLRPYRIISLINRINNLSKIFEKEYEDRKVVTPELREIKKEFYEKIKEIKSRLMSFSNEIVTVKKENINSPEFSMDKDTEEKIKLKLNKNASSKFTFDKNLSETINSMSDRLRGLDVALAHKILSQTTYGYGEDFDEEVRKEILNRIK